MKFFATAAAFVGAASAMQYSNVTYTTEVVTAYTTYCPAATQVTMAGKTYTVSEATTLTITDCPCTISKPVMSMPAPSATAAPSAPKPVVAPAPVGPMNYTTTVITTDVITTYCPQPTTFTTNNKTYTVTSATTLTISDCPCHLTKTVPVTTSTTTYVTDYFTTYCPTPTTITTNSKTYTVTKPTTLTISDCPCTMTKTTVMPVMPVSQSTSPAKPSVTGFVPVMNGTSTNSTASSTKSMPLQQTGNAGSRIAGAGAGAVAGLAGLAFFL